MSTQTSIENKMCAEIYIGCLNMHYLMIIAVDWPWFFRLFSGCTILPCGLNSLTYCWMLQTISSLFTTFSSLWTWNWRWQETLCFAAKSSNARRFSRHTSLNARTNRKHPLFLSESGHVYQYYYDHVTIDFIDTATVFQWIEIAANLPPNININYCGMSAVSFLGQSGNKAIHVGQHGGK